MANILGKKDRCFVPVRDSFHVKTYVEIFFLVVIITAQNHVMYCCRQRLKADLLSHVKSASFLVKRSGNLHVHIHALYYAILMSVPLAKFSLNDPVIVVQWCMFLSV